jgi:two-component system sensor histidine kinase HydH
MAFVAALALVATVLVARRTLVDATDVVVRGEADSLVVTVLADLAELDAPPDANDLARELAAQEAKGLRYVALVGRDGAVMVEAGVSRIDAKVEPPGPPVVVDTRARLAAPVFPHRHGPRPEGFRPGLPHERLRGPVLLVVELEPPVLARLRAGFTRLAVVAAASGAVLVAFAFAWARSARRTAELELEASRKQRLVALGTMSSVMAHELRNPLASLKGHAQLLVEDLDEGKLRKKAERVVAEARRIEELTTSLLDFVRDGPVERETLAVPDLVERSLHDLPREHVRVSLDGAPKTVALDARRVARAIHNLVHNALAASPEGREVELRIEADRDDLVVRVLDHGPGLPPASEAQIFEPFVTTRVRGVGLGLPVARRVAEQHGGSVLGHNRPEGGAELVLRLANTRGAT